MVKTEYFMTLNNGTILNRSYSTEGFYIERDGELYIDAVDNAALDRVYTETNIPIEGETATEEDYLKALDALGVSEDE